MKERNQQNSKPAVCLTPGCDCKPHSRGVCHTCHRDLSDLVSIGKYTDEKLVKLGRWLAAKKPGRPRVKKVEAALAGK